MKAQITKKVNDVFIIKPLIYCLLILVPYTLIVKSITFFKSEDKLVKVNINNYNEVFIYNYNFTNFLNTKLASINEGSNATFTYYAIYTEDLKYRLTASSSDNTSAVQFTKSEELVDVESNLVYADQLKEHLYNRCFTANVNEIEDGLYKQSMIKYKASTAISCPIYLYNDLQGYVVTIYENLIEKNKESALVNKLKLNVGQVESTLEDPLSIYNSFVSTKKDGDDKLKLKLGSSSLLFFNSTLLLNKEYYASVYLLDKNNNSALEVSKIINGELKKDYISKFQVHSYFKSNIDSFKETRECQVLNVRYEGTSFLEKYIKARGSSSSLLCPIFTGNNVLIGFTELYSDFITINKLQEINKDYSSYIKEDLYLLYYKYEQKGLS